MNKVQSILGLVLFILFAHTAYAIGISCSLLPGFWHGATHLKNPTECNAFNGCTHLVIGIAEQQGNNKQTKRIGSKTKSKRRWNLNDQYCPEKYQGDE